MEGHLLTKNNSSNLNASVKMGPNFLFSVKNPVKICSLRFLFLLHFGVC